MKAPMESSAYETSRATARSVPLSASGGDEGHDEADGPNDVDDAMHPRDVELVAERVLEVGQPARGGGEGAQAGQSQDPGQGHAQLVDTEPTEDQQEHGRRCAADDHVGEERVQGVTDPRAIQEVLEQLPGPAQAAIGRVDDAGDPT